MAARHVWDARTSEAFEAVDRRRFLPADVVHLAGKDRPLPIGFGQTNSQPSTVAAMLDLLSPEPGHGVLDVGSGSGWSTALLAHMVGPSGHVLGVERVRELAERGAANLAGLDMPWAQIQLADPAVLGAPELAPFDRILVSAGAEELPNGLVDQLATGGILVVPVGGRMLRVVRRPGGRAEVTDHGAYTFVPLLTDDPQGRT